MATSGSDQIPIITEITAPLNWWIYNIWAIASGSKAYLSPAFLHEQKGFLFESLMQTIAIEHDTQLKRLNELNSVKYANKKIP